MDKIGKVSLALMSFCFKMKMESFHSILMDKSPSAYGQIMIAEKVLAIRFVP